MKRVHACKTCATGTHGPAVIKPSGRLACACCSETLTLIYSINEEEK